MSVERQLADYGKHLRRAIVELDVRVTPDHAVRPVPREGAARRRRWLVAAAAAAAVVAVVATAVLLWPGRGRESVPYVDDGSTTTFTTTTGAATTATTASIVGGFDALSAFTAGPVPSAAVCPPGSTPDTPGDASAPRPPGLDGPLKPGLTTMAFDRESGLLVLSVSGSTWVFDPCRNRWQEMASGGPDLDGGFMAYDADSDLVVAFDTSGVWAYDVDQDTWTRTGRPVAIGLPLYHHPSGLLIIDRWAYDVDTGSWHYLRPEAPDLPSGLLAYDPIGDRFYLYSPGGCGEGHWCADQGTNEPQTWRCEPGEGWAQLEVPTPGLYGGFPSWGSEIAYDESGERVVVFSSGWVAAFDPSMPEWEVLYDRWDEEGPLNRWGHSMVYDSANGRLIVVGGYLSADGWPPATDIWAFDTDTRGWIELLPAG